MSDDFLSVCFMCSGSSGCKWNQRRSRRQREQRSRGETQHTCKFTLLIHSVFASAVTFISRLVDPGETRQRRRRRRPWNRWRSRTPGESAARVQSPSCSLGAAGDMSQLGFVLYMIVKRCMTTNVRFIIEELRCTCHFQLFMSVGL